MAIQAMGRDPGTINKLGSSPGGQILGAIFSGGASLGGKLLGGGQPGGEDAISRRLGEQLQLGPALFGPSGGIDPGLSPNGVPLQSSAISRRMMGMG